MGLVGMALGPLFSARPGVLLTPQAFVKRPADWLKAISRYRATVSFAPNFAYELSVRRVKDRDLEGLDLSSWRVAGCGAEPIHAPTLAAFAERFAAVGFPFDELPAVLRPGRARAGRHVSAAERETCASIASAADDLTEQRRAVAAPPDGPGGRAGQLRPRAAGARDPDCWRVGRAGRRARGRRDYSARSVRDAGLL